MPLPRTLRRIRSQWGWIVAAGLFAGFILAVVAISNGRGAPGRDLPSLADVTTTVRPAVSVPRVVVTAPSGTGRPATPAPPGFVTEALSALPADGQAAWQRLAAGGPHPHDDDGTAFEDTKKRLPPRPLGWYRRYAAEEGEPHGTRLLVVGQDKATFWTVDGGSAFVYVDVNR